VALAGGGGKLNGATGSDDYDGFAVKAWGHGIIVHYYSYCFYSDRFRFELCTAGGSGVVVRPVKGASVGMNPEEAAVAVIGHFAAAGFAGVFPEEFADHGLGDCLNHAWVGAAFEALGQRHAVEADVEAFIEFRSKRGE